jgi:PKD repeat protein
LQYASTKISTFGLAVIATMMAMAVGDAQTPKTATPSSGVAYFTAAPTSGQAPLTVTFCAFAGIAIDFGDGTSSAMGMAQGGDCPAGASSMTKHTYVAAGSYQLNGFPCPSSAHGMICGEVAQQAGTVKITVTPAP